MGSCHLCAMGLHRAREDRRTIFLKVRLRADGDWREVSIGNVSPHGLMLRGASLPPKGAFIEVRHRGTCVIGRIVWSAGSRCGVRTQDRIDIPALLSPSPIQPRKGEIERRQMARPRNEPPPAYRLVERAEASRRFAKMFEWSLVVAGGAFAAVALAGAASSALERPLDRVRVALEPAGDRG